MRTSFTRWTLAVWKKTYIQSLIMPHFPLPSCSFQPSPCSVESNMKPTQMFCHPITHPPYVSSGRWPSRKSTHKVGFLTEHGRMQGLTHWLMRDGVIIMEGCAVGWARSGWTSHIGCCPGGGKGWSGSSVPHTVHTAAETRYSQSSSSGQSGRELGYHSDKTTPWPVLQLQWRPSGPEWPIAKWKMYTSQYLCPKFWPRVPG